MIRSGQVKCLVPGCEDGAEPHQEMCGSHWAVVPLPLRRTIVRLRGQPGHDEAVANAVSQLLERLYARRSVRRPGSV